MTILKEKFVLNDNDIRCALKIHLQEKYKNKSRALIIEELSVLNGAARIDVVAITKHMHGYEIKSDLDKLYRLPEQIKNYSLIFDKVTLVVGFKHIFEALKIIPDWWGVKIAELQSDNEINFINFRENKLNIKSDLYSLIKLLWKDEALYILNEFSGSKRFNLKSRKEIYLELSKISNVKALHLKIINQLRKRPDWKFDLRQKLYDG